MTKSLILGLFLLFSVSCATTSDTRPSDTIYTINVYSGGQHLGARAGKDIYWQGSRLRYFDIELNTTVWVTTEAVVIQHPERTR